MLAFALLVSGLIAEEHFQHPALLARIGSNQFLHRRDVSLLGISADGKWLYTAEPAPLNHNDAAFYVWETATGKLRARHDLSRYDGIIMAIGFGPNGLRVLARDSGTYQLLIVDPRTNRITRVGQPWKHPFGVISEGAFRNAWSNFDDSATWMVRSADERFSIFNTENGRETIIDSGNSHIPYGTRTGFSPDGQLAFASNKQTRLFSFPSGKLLTEIKKQGDEEFAADFTPDSKELLLWTRHDKVWSLDAWDLGRKTSRPILRDLPNPGKISFAPDGKRIALLPAHVGAYHPDGDWEVREYPSGKLLATLPAGLSINSAIFSPDGRTLYTQAGPRLIVAWDIATGKPANASSNVLGPVMRFRFTPEGKLVGLAGGFVYTWDPLTGKELDRKRLPKPIDRYGAAMFSPNADRLHYTGLNDRLIAWDFHSGKLEEHDLNLHRLPNTAVLQWFTRDGSRHVEMDYENVALRFRDPATGKETGKTSIRGDWTLALGIIATDLSADGRRIAFASTNAGLSNDPPSNIAVLSIDGTGRPLTFQSPGIIRVLAMSPDGQLLVSCPNNSLSRDLIVWSASQGRRVASEFLGVTESVNALSFSPDRRMLAISTGRHQVLLIETATWQVRASVPIPGREPGGYLGYIEARDPVAWSADGHLLATATHDERLMVWDIRKLAAASSITTAEDLEREWKKLSARDAKAAYAAIRSLAEAPEKALPLLKVKVAVVPVPDPAKVKAAIAALGSEEFAEREAATAELAKLGRLAEPAIREELRTTGSPEVMRRLGDLLKKLDAAKPTAEEVAATRAVEIAEWIGTPDAAKLLDTWAAGADGARLTIEAKNALAHFKGK